MSAFLLTFGAIVQVLVGGPHFDSPAVKMSEQISHTLAAPSAAQSSLSEAIGKSIVRGASPLAKGQAELAPVLRVCDEPACDES